MIAKLSAWFDRLDGYQRGALLCAIVVIGLPLGCVIGLVLA